jgi:hypothetical protein
MLLNIAYLVFFLSTFPYAMTRNRLFGFYYAALYIYSAFAIAGYLYLPGVSESIAAYFGDEVGRTALIFTLLSMTAFWVVNMAIYRPKPARRAWLLVSYEKRVTTFGGALTGAFSIVFIGLLALNFSTLSWYIFEETETLPLQTVIFIGLYKTTVGILASGYVIIRSRDISRNRVHVTSCLLLALAFLIASVRLGNRTDPAAILLGIIMYETLVRKLRLRSIAIVGSGVLIAVLALSAIEYFRYTDGGIQAPLLERVVRNDYYAPAHMLFAAIAFNVVDPWIVVQSNSGNALILLGEPYLQQVVTEMFRSNIATRSAGYAFYILAEGWMFAGWAGVLYNAIIPSIGLWLWNRLSCTSDRLFNQIALALVACMLLNVTRGQSSYFIKYLYTFVIPNLGLAAIVLGLRLRPAWRDDQAFIPAMVDE